MHKMWFSSYATGQTDKPTNRHTHHNTLHPPGGKVIGSLQCSIETMMMFWTISISSGPENINFGPYRVLDGPAEKLEIEMVQNRPSNPTWSYFRHRQLAPISSLHLSLVILIALRTNDSGLRGAECRYKWLRSAVEGCVGWRGGVTLGRRTSSREVPGWSTTA